VVIEPTARTGGAIALVPLSKEAEHEEVLLSSFKPQFDSLWIDDSGNAHGLVLIVCISRGWSTLSQTRMGM
jgi:hypothetical protein